MPALRYSVAGWPGSARGACGSRSRTSPEQSSATAAGGVRRGDQDLDEGPAWRIVYSDDQAPGSDVRLVVVAAVGRGHTPAGQADAYELAELRLKETRKSRKENQ